ncbi:MAG TPA: YegS/Rv2252/BmrU family lipid kinase [Ignavibacteriaceae bacterium]|nr:YegS/Rv2252/BmrU family lipid kinase [Ignavibacteriaceae bacterium]
MNAKIPYIIFNSFSAGGKTSKQMKSILGCIKSNWDNFRFFITQDSLHAESVVRFSIKDGVELIIAVGGDGTIQSAANGFFENGNLINKDCALGIISSGTGQGLAQSLSIAPDILSQIELIKRDKTRCLDVGKIQFKEGSKPRYFINEFQAGIGGAVVKNVSVNLKKYGGKFSFGLGTLAAVFNYKPETMDFIMDNKRIIRNLLGLVVSNGKYTGGGMQLTPNASPADGLFDVLFIPSMSTLKRLTEFPKIYSAKHITSNGFEYFKARKIKMLNTNGSLIEADGELINEKCSTIEIVPHCLRVFAN